MPHTAREMNAQMNAQMQFTNQMQFITIIALTRNTEENYQ